MYSLRRPVYKYVIYFSMEIKNKIVIVTGASQGIGEALARALTRSGATVVLAARSVSKLEALTTELGSALVVPTDMRVPEDIQKLVDTTVEKYDRVDLLINNAGQGMYGPVESINVTDYKAIMDLNVYAPLMAMQRVIPIMRRQGGGMILNISSRVSKNYYPHLAAYASTKYALNALSLTARAELAPDKIVVSVFHPKMTATNFGVNAIGERPAWATNPPPDMPRPEVDTPEQVAEKVLEQIRSEEAEVMM